MLKNTLFSATFLFAPSVWACPDLQGEYTCRDPEADSTTELTMRIAQKDENGVTLYEFSAPNDPATQTIVTDGEKHAEADIEMIKNKTYTATCEANELRLIQEFDYVGPESRYHLIARTAFTKNAEGVLELLTTGRVTSDQGETEVAPGKQVCRSSGK